MRLTLIFAAVISCASLPVADADAAVVTGLTYAPASSVSVMAPTTLTVNTGAAGDPHVLVSPTTPDPAPATKLVPDGQNVTAIQTATDAGTALAASHFSWTITLPATHAINRVAFSVALDPTPPVGSVTTFQPPAAGGVPPSTGLKMGANVTTPAGFDAPISGFGTSPLVYNTTNPAGVVGGTYTFVFTVDIGKPGPAPGGTPGSFLLTSQVSNPEPGSMALAAVAMTVLGGGAARRRHKKKQKAQAEAEALAI